MTVPCFAFAPVTTAYHHRLQPGRCTLPPEMAPPESVGHRCLARGLSDIAAMVGIPAAFLSLALPAKLPQSWVDGFIRGVLKLAHDSGILLAGGDTAQSPSGVLADIIVLGRCAEAAVLRSGAVPAIQLRDWNTWCGRCGAEFVICKTQTRAQAVSQAFLPAAKNSSGTSSARRKNSPHQ